MFEAVDHLLRYAQNIEQDIGKLTTGSKIRYKRKKPNISPKKKRNFNDGRPPDTTVHLLPMEQLTSQTPYKLAYIANISASSTTCPDAPIRSGAEATPMDTTDDQVVVTPLQQIQFLKNAYSSCYASSPLFILFHIFQKGFVKLLLKLFPELPSNMKHLTDLFHLVRQKKFLQCRQQLMSYIWSHQDGAHRGQLSSYTKFFHCYLENHPSLNFTAPPQVSVFRNITGIIYLFHTWCLNCGYSNKLIHLPMVEVTVDQIKRLDFPPDITPDLETIINYRHHHSHEESRCTKCTSVRKHWYSTITAPLIVVINLESLLPGPFLQNRTKIDIPMRITIDSLPGRINLKCIGSLTHLSDHWTSTLLTERYDSIYEYDDLVGMAVLRPFDSSYFVMKPTAGLVYLRDYDTEYVDQCMIPSRVRYHHGDSVDLLNRSKETVGFGVVEEVFWNGIVMVRVSKVNSEEKDELLFGSMKEITTIQQCLNNIVVWDSTHLVLVSSARVPQIQSRKRKPSSLAESSTSTSSSLIDLDILRAKSKSRREAKTIRQAKEKK